MAEADESLTGKDGTRSKRSSSFRIIPPDFSELRLVLLGNSWSQRSFVGNLLLKKQMFDAKREPQKTERLREERDGQTLIVVNTPDLQRSDLNVLTQDIKTLSAPGPHAFLLVLQPEDFTEQHNNRLQSVLESFGEQAFNHSLVLISKPRGETPGFMEKYMNDPQIRDIISKCKYRYPWIKNTEDDPNLKKFKREELFTRIGQMLKERNEESVSCGPSQEEDTSTEQRQSLNLVLCGSRGAEKSSVVESILSQAAAPSPGQCVKHQGEVCGRWVSLVELPALSGEPLEAVMQQCLSCISLCGPEGVHAFILVLPVGPLTDQDKAELKTIQDTFSSAVNPFTMILFTVEEDVQKFCQGFGGGYRKFHTGGQQQVSEFVCRIEELRAKNKPHRYKTETLQQAHIKKIVALDQELQLQKSMNKKHDRENSNSRRIVLFGKAGSGKSSLANAILGKSVFKSDLSPEPVTISCQKAEAEVGGRHVAVVDTPGLIKATDQEVNDKMLKGVNLLAPGPHVFLVVLEMTRITNETEILGVIKKLFGTDAARFTIFVFTHREEQASVEKFLGGGCELKKEITNFGNRYCSFNYRKQSGMSQVTELMKKIDDLVKANGGGHYTNNMLPRAKAEVKKM